MRGSVRQPICLVVTSHAALRPEIIQHMPLCNLELRFNYNKNNSGFCFVI
jgi:hypothetical protein